jgi:cysteine synthase
MKNEMLELVGNTPIVDVSFFSPKKEVRIFAKLESFNPSGSIKDRLAVKMIEDAERRGLLTPGDSIIEPTSGNTGIALAFVSAKKGYKFTAVMPSSVSEERAQIIKAYDGEVIRVEGDPETNYSLKTMYEKAEDIRKKVEGVILDQFKNKSNFTVHRDQTAKELIDQLPDITNFVAGIGTGGTLAGISMGLKRYNTAISSWGVEPTLNSRIQGLHNRSDYSPPVLEMGAVEGILSLGDKEESLAIDLTRKLIAHGISVGLSSGANLWGAIEIAKRLEAGVVATVFADGMEKYLSTGLI